MMLKKTFTLLELLIVTLLLAALTAALKSYFQMKDQDINKARTCMNYTFGSVKNFLDFSITGRGMLSGNSSVYKYPENYIIEFSGLKDRLIMRYTGTAIDKSNYQVINFSGKYDTGNSLCHAINYYINMSGANYTLKLKNDFSFEINNDPTKFTGSVDFYFCSTFSSGCMQFSQFAFDKRVNQIRYRKCDKYVNPNNKNKCKTWYE